ncbi:MAG: AAA family ATPase [Candidatus Polarisedimenticolaceae bacterium]|nr:AAA family ATPase [Candidatus Polarisedimenticolaceae bacterium]
MFRDNEMYYDYFGLEFPPYRITPDTRVFYAGGERGAILDAAAYAIRSGDAITKVVGEVGSGKTMLCRMLETKLPARIEIIYLANPSLTPENILHAIALELDLPEANEPSRLKVMKALEAYLLKKHAENYQVALFVEEAQGMPLETLEEIRLLSNLETRHHKLLQVVLFGQPELDVGLSAPHVRQIKERITNSFYLKPLGSQDISEYLMFRLEIAGYRGPNIYQPAAIRKLTRASKGLMRRINILADKSMLAAYTDESHIVTAQHVSAAIEDSEFVTTSAIWRPALLSAVAAGALTVAVGLALMNGQSFSPVSVADFDKPVAVMIPPVPQQVASTVEVALGAEDISVAQTVKDDLLQNRIDITRRWLPGANPKHFSIQLMLAEAAGERRVVRFLQQQSSQQWIDQLYVHRVNVRGQEMLGVLYGEYASYSAAEAVLKQLPSGLARYRPYLRNLRQIQAESIFLQPAIAMLMDDY